MNAFGEKNGTRTRDLCTECAALYLSLSYLFLDGCEGWIRTTDVSSVDDLQSSGFDQLSKPHIKVILDSTHHQLLCIQEP